MTPVTSRRQVQIGLELGGDPSTGRATGGSHPVPRAGAGANDPAETASHSSPTCRPATLPEPNSNHQKEYHQCRNSGLAHPKIFQCFRRVRIWKTVRSFHATCPSHHIRHPFPPCFHPWGMPDLMASHGILLPSSSSIFSPNELAWGGLPVPLTVQWTPSP